MSESIVKNRFVKILYLMLIAGLALSVIVEEYHGNWRMLHYFTYLSNIMVILMFSVQIVFELINIIGKRRDDNELQIPAVINGLVNMCILFTFLTVFFVLSPFEAPSDWHDARKHYLVPLFTILEFVLFEKHGRYKGYYPFCWLAAPALYYGYVLILVSKGVRFGSSLDLFPYFFMDYISYGWGFVWKILAVLVVVFLILGYVMCFVDRILKH